MLSISTTITPPDWMLCEETAQLYGILNESAEPCALFVGGCVRNLLLEKPVKDIDIACTYLPEEVMELLEKNNIKVIPTGIEHGTVTAVINHKSFEITTLRKDIKTDGRRAVVSFTKDWVEDAKRRDFSMNTLLCDDKGNIYDPLEKGVKDLKEGRVIFVGEPSNRIKEDVLRILRFFRFYAYYGSGEPDQKALSACMELAPLISNLSKERVGDEFFKILMAQNGKEILSLMFAHKVLIGLPKELKSAQLIRSEQHLEARLLLLTGFTDDALEHLGKFFILSNKQKKKLELISGAFKQINEISEREVKICFYRFGKEAAIQAYCLFSALNDKNIDLVNKLDDKWDIPLFPLGGKELLALGFKQDKALGETLKILENYWIENDFTPDANALILKAKNHL